MALTCKNVTDFLVLFALQIVATEQQTVVQTKVSILTFGDRKSLGCSG